MLDDHDDERVVEAITAVKGLGRWSAEMFLMFRLNRPDVFLSAISASSKGMQRLLEMKSRPAPSTMLRTAELWRPYRSVAAWYCGGFSNRRMTKRTDRGTTEERQSDEAVMGAASRQRQDCRSALGGDCSKLMVPDNAQSPIVPTREFAPRPCPARALSFRRPNLVFHPVVRTRALAPSVPARAFHAVRRFC